MEPTPRVIDTTSAKTCYVAVVLQDKAYGGPEEGGWWYDTEQVLEQKQAHSREHRQELINNYLSQYSNEGRRDISSVASEGIYAIRVQKKKVTDYPQYRPHYE